MAFMAAALPYIAAAGTAVAGAQQYRASQYNAAVEKNEAIQAINQTNAAEGQVRRADRLTLGKQLAAFGAAGVGYGGSSEVALDQTAVQSELDALNTRYKGATTAYGYNTQSGIDLYRGNMALAQAGLVSAGSMYKAMGYNSSGLPNAPSNG